MPLAPETGSGSVRVGCNESHPDKGMEEVVGSMYDSLFLRQESEEDQVPCLVGVSFKHLFVMPAGTGLRVHLPCRRRCVSE
jgi:hypothetical protein